ncbi:hypothetical protein KR084_002677, partial [Drosophila pseudotakahashii]
LEMEPCDPGPERVMRQYLSQLLETGTTRSAGCLDRFVAKGMTNFPPSSTSIEGKASRCSLFEQLLCGGSRRSERLLVPDLATEWFRKQKVFLDKLTPEELAALSAGLAKSRQKKDPEAIVAKVAACLPTTEPRTGNGNPFLIGQTQAEEMRGGGIKSPRLRNATGHSPTRRGSCSYLKRRSCSCLFQADGQPMVSDCLAARRTEPLLPRLRRKFDLRQAPQRRLDPALFRRISPEFFRILASYEEAMSESCPLYGISLHHWGDTKACCPCGERHSQLKQQRFLGDETVATAVVPPPSWPPLEREGQESMQQPAARRHRETSQSPSSKKQPEKKTVKYAKEKPKRPCHNETCTNDACRGVKESKETKEEAVSSGDEGTEAKRRKQEDKRQRKQEEDQQEVRQVQSRQSVSQSSNPPENRQPERRLWRRGGDQQTSQSTNPPERRRKFPNCFRRPPAQTYRTGCVPCHAHPSIAPSPPVMSSDCPASHQPKGILGGFTGICKRCMEPGRHLLYNLNANYQQNRERYGQIRQDKQSRKRQKEQDQSFPFQMTTQPAPCSWGKSRGGDWEEEAIEEGDSSTTLRPQVLQAKSEQSLAFRTPISERTLAGWNPSGNPSTPKENQSPEQQEQQCTKAVMQCQADCKCGLPQEAFQLPPVDRCTCPPDRPGEQVLLQSSEVRQQGSEKALAGGKSSSSEADYAKCGHRTRACYLANDFHQLMRRVAKRRARTRPQVLPGRPKTPRTLSTPNRLPTKSKEAPAVCPGTQVTLQPATTEASPKTQTKPKVRPKPKTKVMGPASQPDECVVTKVKKKPVDRGPIKESLREDASSLSLSICQAQSDIPSVRRDSQERPKKQSLSASNLSSGKTPPPTREPPRSTSPRERPKTRMVCRSKRSPCSRKPMNPKRTPSCCSFCSSLERSGGRRERSSSGRQRRRQRCVRQEVSAASHYPESKASSISEASYWRPPRQQDRRQRFLSTSCSDAYSSTQYSKAWEDRDADYRCPPLKSAMKKAPIQWQVDPSDLETGRRYYTDTQPKSGQEAGPRCSCRSLRSSSSIRALSSNTDSVRCPCAPAPSVASVEEEEQEEKGDQEDQGYQEEGQCICCRYHTPAPHGQPMPEPYFQPSAPPPPPPPCPCRRPKPTFFSNALRWEPQQHHHARTLLRTQRPPPPSPKHQQLASYPQYQAENPPEWIPDYPAPCRYPEPVTNPEWEDQVEDSQYYTQEEHYNYPMQEDAGPRNSYHPGRDRGGAITAAAQGLRGLVKALGGARIRSRHHSQLDYYYHHQTGYCEDQAGGQPPDYATNCQAQEATTSAFLPRTNHSVRRNFNSYMDNQVDERLTTRCNVRRSMENEQQSWFRMKAGETNTSVRERQRGGGGGGSPGFLLPGSDIGSRTKKPSSLNEGHEKCPTATPLAKFFDCLRAKHAASEILTRKTQQTASKEPRKVATLENVPKPMRNMDGHATSSSSSDNDTNDWNSRHRRRRSPSEETMVIPSTYTGLLEEQVLGEYLPNPRCKRRS